MVSKRFLWVVLCGMVVLGLNGCGKVLRAMQKCNDEDVPKCITDTSYGICSESRLMKVECRNGQVCRMTEEGAECVTKEGE